MEGDYVNENARLRWIERHAALAPAPVKDEQDEEGDEHDDEDEDDEGDD